MFSCCGSRRRPVNSISRARRHPTPRSRFSRRAQISASATRVGTPHSRTRCQDVARCPGAIQKCPVCDNYSSPS
ncbi:hypothetical protein BDW66DRAFT_144039 [Aspergillus desertorum]